MIPRILLVLALSAAFAHSEPLQSPPATRPATSHRSISARPTTRPATQPSRSGSLLGSLFGQKSTPKPEQSSSKVALIDLDRPVGEQPPPFVLLADTSLTLQSVLGRLQQARDQKDVRAVLLNIGDTGFNLAQAQEVRDALASLNRAGKRTFVYADSFDTASYIAASGATDVCMLSGGEIMMPGVALETMFAKGLLDKIGLKADYIQIGQYKGADEQFTRTEPSAELRGELNKIVDSLYQQIVDGIAYHRHLSRGDVEEIIGGVMLTAKVARDRGLVDHLVDQDDLRDLLKKEMGREVSLLEHYGEPRHDPMDLSNPLSLLGMLAGKPQEKKAAPESIAIIYVEGVIVDGEGSDGLLSDGLIGSEDIRQALRIALRDNSIKAIVLRIDSPGGSALASEAMWQAVRRASDKKPLVVSVGGMAASGGYYVACASDTIFADPTAIVGSIGVVGGKFVFKDLFEKVGIHTETFSRGQNAGLFSSNEPFTEQQRRLVTRWMQQTYEQFTERVMQRRAGKIKDIDQVAHGRVFVAKQARELGMVDEIGGLEKAIARAAQRAGLAKDTFQVRPVPGTKSLLDLFRGEDEPEAEIPSLRSSIAADSLLQSLPTATSSMLRQQVQMLRLLQKRPVMLTSPFVLRIR